MATIPSEDLQDYREKSATLNSGRLEKYSLTPTQAALYFDSIAPHGEFRLTFRLRAKYPVRARRLNRGRMSIILRM